MADFFKNLQKKMEEAHRNKIDEEMRKRDEYYNSLSNEELANSDASIARKARIYEKRLKEAQGKK